MSVCKFVCVFVCEYVSMCNFKDGSFFYLRRKTWGRYCEGFCVMLMSYTIVFAMLTQYNATKLAFRTLIVKKIMSKVKKEYLIRQ